MTTSPIASSIMRIFPKDKAMQKGKKNSALVPFFSLASGKSEEKIIEELKQRDCQYVEPKYGLTALSVATILRKYNVMRFLINEKKVNPNSVDKACFTAHHYAFIHNDKKALQLLGQAQQIAASTKDFFQMYPGWKKVLHPEYPKANETVFYYRNEQGTIVPGTAQQFFQQTHAKFNDDVSADLKALRSLWADQLESSSRYKKNPLSKIFNDYLCSQLLDSKSDPKNLYMGKQGCAGNGTFAGQNLTAGKPYFIYGGRVFDANGHNKKSDFIFNQVDSNEEGNVPSRINDGFPNCNFFHVQFPDGRSYEVLVPLRNIKPGEGLFWNYGYEHEIKFGPRAELNSAEMLTFFSEHSLRTLFIEIAKQYQEIQKIEDFSKLEEIALKLFEVERKQICLRYIFQTPNAFISLFFHDRLSFKDIQFFLKNEVFQNLMGAKHFKGLLDNIKTIEEQLKYLTERFPEDIKSKDFKNFFIEFCNKYSYHTICAALQYLKQEETSSKPWSEVKVHLEKFVEILENIHAAVFWDDTKMKKDFSDYGRELSKLPGAYLKFTNFHLAKKAYNNPAIKNRLLVLQAANA